MSPHQLSLVVTIYSFYLPKCISSYLIFGAYLISSLDKPMPCVFVMIARPSYLGSWQPDCDMGLQLVGACPKPGFLLRYVVEFLVNLNLSYLFGMKCAL